MAKETGSLFKNLCVIEGNTEEYTISRLFKNDIDVTIDEEAGNLKYIGKGNKVLDDTNEYHFWIAVS